MKLDHVANRIHAQHFDTVVTMFQTELGFLELRRTDRSVWLRQPGANVDLQFSRSPEAKRDADKLRSQVSFLSDTPQADLERLQAWFNGQGIEAAVGAYSSKEFYLDAPAALVDFVIEAMLPEMADYPIKA